MKKTLLKSALLLCGLTTVTQADAQEYVPFDIYGFMTKSDVSYDTPQSQQYVVSRMVYTVDSTNPYFIQKQTSAFDTNEEIDNQWVKVSSCYVRNGVMYAVRRNAAIGLNQISTFDSMGKETVLVNVPADNGYIMHAAYVPQEDMVYMVLSSTMSSKADLYKAPGDDPSNMTFVANICNSFMEKPCAFTYCSEKQLLFYITNAAGLYSLSLSGEKDYYYNTHADDAALPSDGSDGSTARFSDEGSGLVWSAVYNMLIWCCPRGESAGSGLSYWYGLDLIKGSETPTVHRLITHVDSGLSNNYYNCMTTEGMELTQGLPPAPTYVSVYRVNGKPGYFDVSWPAVKNDIDGNPIEGDVYYNVYVGDNLIAKKDQPAKGITVGVRFLLPHAYTEDTFYVGVETVTEAGTSSMKVEGPNKSMWDPDDPGHWYEDPEGGVYNICNSSIDVMALGNHLSISGLEGTIANIYAIDGKLVKTITEDSMIELPTGLYLVKTVDGTYKVMVK